MNDLLVKKHAETSSLCGCSPCERKVEEYINNGFIIVDKPSGPTSHEVTSWVKKMLGASKAGHSGTLDPRVTGVLPTAIGNATKVMPALVRQDKEYICLMRLHKEVPREQILATAKSFVGIITQMPPVKSGVKRVQRKRKIHYLELLEVDGQNVLFITGCEAGTYIRVLCTAFGKCLGVGAQMQELRRTKAGSFSECDSVKLQDIKDAYELWKDEGTEKYIKEVIKPIEFALKDTPKVFVKDSSVSAICHGAPLHTVGVSKIDPKIKKDKLIAIMSLKGELIALGKAKMESLEMLKKRKGVAALVERVIMKKDVYPRMWKSKI